jgi:taurine dioxygenase
MTSLSAVKDVETTGEIDIRPQTATIGAEVYGVDLSARLDAATLTAIHEALLRWRILFFREQNVGHAEHVQLAQQLGTPVYPHPHDDGPKGEAYPDLVIVDGYPELYRVTNEFTELRRAQAGGDSIAEAYNNSYRGLHTDSTATANPPAISILRAESVPPYGGDTTYYNLVTAYEVLSEPVRKFVDQLWAEHAFSAALDYPGETRTAHHPVVRVIPETGERALNINPVFTTKILGVSLGESEWILDFLYTQIIRPGFAARFKWDNHSVAIADNRVAAHIGPQDLPNGTARILHLALVEGDVPISTDGVKSEQVFGRPYRPSTAGRGSFG